MTLQKNKCELIGWSGHDAQVKTTPKGHSVVTLNIATHRFSKDDEGTAQSVTEWHRCVFFNRLAERVAEVKKGDHLLVEGRIIPRVWQDKQGCKHHSVEIHAHSVQVESKTDEQKPLDVDEEATPLPEDSHVEEESRF